MIAVDTNIVLRLILADDEQQLAAIVALMDRETLCVPLTVMLETGWVLASRYAMPRGTVAGLLREILTLDGVHAAHAEITGWAIDRYAEGADWADMIHLVAAAEIGRFATLDRLLRKQAGETPVADILLVR